MGNDRTRRSRSESRAPKRTAPHRGVPPFDVAPIIPVLRSHPFNDPDWLFEPKYDGFRGLVYIAAGTCLIRSKKGTTFKRFAPLCEAIPRELDVKNAIIDGEVLALDKTGHPQFTDLLTGPTTLAYAAFDLLWLNGRDLRHLPLTKRKAEWAKLIPSPGVQVFKVFTVDERGWDLFEAVQRTDFEGIVAKRKSDPYAPGAVWFKVKNPRYTQAPGLGDLFNRPRRG
jgi:bifunctional non-homologous end joining protein LigD